MIGIIVAAHGELASALVHTAQLVVPSATRITAVAIDSGDDTASYEARLKSAVDGLSDTDGVLVLTDMFGGTPSNVGLTLHQPGRVEVLTGANLPMLVKALQLSQRGVDLSTVASHVKQSGQQAITVASEVLARNHHAERAS